MSTLITFGYLRAPQGQPNAQAVQYVLLNDGDTWDSSDPNYALATSPPYMLVADASGNIIQGPLAGMPGVIAPSVGTPWTTVLRDRYWPANVGTGFFRENLGYVCTGSIRVSAAEAAVLKRFGALA